MNKPQCETAADCLEQLARVMRQFEITSPLVVLHSKYVKEASGWFPKEMPAFNRPQDWSFAIAEVEGKPVFPYQAGLFYKGYPFTPAFSSEGFYDIESFSWNPPRPKTVMVEMLVDDAVWMATSQAAFYNARAAEACKKALEELK